MESTVRFCNHVTCKPRNYCWGLIASVMNCMRIGTVYCEMFMQKLIGEIDTATKIFGVNSLMILVSKTLPPLQMFGYEDELLKFVFKNYIKFIYQRYITK